MGCCRARLASVTLESYSLRRYFIVILGFITSLAFLTNTRAQTSVSGLREGGFSYIALNEVARLEGFTTTENNTSLTIRSPDGVLVVFANSPDVLWQPSGGGQEGGDIGLSAPVLRRGATWYGPPDAVELLGLVAFETSLVLSNNTRVNVNYPAVTASALGVGRSELTELGNGVYGLSLFASGSAGSDTLSMLLADVGLLSLAFPERQREFDGVLGQFEDARPLFFSVTAVTSNTWTGDVTFQQQGRRFIAQPPYGLVVLSGDSRRVSPQEPVSGVILLPTSFNLRTPMSVSWSGVSASVQFRR